MRNEENEMKINLTAVIEGQEKFERLFFVRMERWRKYGMSKNVEEWEKV
jgi:hypothetical protein